MKILNFLENIDISRKLIIGFLFAIIIGSLILRLPISLQDGVEISFVDSLFTVVSTICVTGLTVVDVSRTFSDFGFSVIAFFIQIGGLGVMTFSLMFFMILGRHTSYSTRELLKAERNSESSGTVIVFIKKLVLTVFIIEMIGAISLFFKFINIMPLKRAIGYSIFHSISAFCNAGFSLFSTNMEEFRDSLIINFTISFLVIFGGLGFAVINSIINFRKKRHGRLNLTSRIAVFTSLILLIVGTVLFFIFEYNNTLIDLDIPHKLMISFFQSTSLRTAGFNTVQLENIKPETALISYFLMFIGASPGSTGGGIKTTTFALSIFFVIGILKKRKNVEIYGRRISWEIMNNALAIIIISMSYIVVATLLILLFESCSIQAATYEVISAFATVGVSLGITPELSFASKIIIMFTMFLGRLGPMTIAIAVAGEKKISNYNYPKEDILIG